MSNQKRTKKFIFGNERFGGSGEFEFKFPDDMSRQDFEKMFSEKMEALHKKGNDIAEEIFDTKSRKENLKPLSIRVKPHTKEFFKNHSILSPRDVLEMYENFNNGSEAFINSLIEEEKELENELAEVQEKLHNARLFREKLSELEPEGGVQTDEDNLAKLQGIFESSQIKTIGNETPVEKAQADIVADIQIYNTQEIGVYDDEYLVITVSSEVQPVVYYFKNEYAEDDIAEVISHIAEFCSENKIEFKKSENQDL